MPGGGIVPFRSGGGRRDRLAKKAGPGPSFRVKALTVVCSDRWRSDQFYTEVLGAVAPAGEIGCRWYRLGSFTLTLMPDGRGRSPATFGEHPLNRLYLEVEDLEAAQRHFARHHVEVIVPCDGQMRIIADPDGLPIEVWRRADEDDDSPA